MRVLIIKLSSMGDIVHTLPALTDATQHLPGITFDWAVEKVFSDIPRWHPAVREIIPCEIRQWRKQLWQSWRQKVWHQFIGHLRHQSYDFIIDAQGLMKSATLCRFAHGVTCGYDKNSIREPIASCLYDKKATVDRHSHAITRIRALFAQSLGYTMPTTRPNYGLSKNTHPATFQLPDNTILACHGTTWPSKQWPDAHWLDFFGLCHQYGLSVAIPFGNTIEKNRAERWRKRYPKLIVLPQSTLNDFRHWAEKAKAVIATDSGLSHIAAATGAITLGLYASTDPTLTGVQGDKAEALSATFPCAPCLKRHCPLIQGKNTPPCYSTLTANDVFDTLTQKLSKRTDKACQIIV